MVLGAEVVVIKAFVLANAGGDVDDGVPAVTGVAVETSVGTIPVVTPVVVAVGASVVPAGVPGDVPAGGETVVGAAAAVVVVDETGTGLGGAGESGADVAGCGVGSSGVTVWLTVSEGVSVVHARTRGTKSAFAWTLRKVYENH